MSRIPPEDLWFSPVPLIMERVGETFALTAPITYCLRCGSQRIALCPIDSEEGIVTAECECGWVSLPWQIYDDPLNARIVIEDILDADVID